MGYRQRLRRDLDRWIEAGLVDADHREAILASASGGSNRMSALGALTILGAILLGLSALTFVGANWDAIPRLARFALLLALVWSSLLASGQAFKADAATLGHALALLGVVLFGASIMLTAQTFNMTDFRNTAVLIWAIAAGLTAWQIRSRPVLILTTGLAALWAGLEAANPYVGGSIWAYLPVAMICAVLAVRMGSTVSLHLTAVAIALWTAHALYLWGEARAVDGLALQAAAALVFGTLALAGATLRDRTIPGGGIVGAIVGGWMTVITLLTAFLIQIPLGESRALPGEALTSAYAGLALAALLAITALGGLRLATRRLTAWELGALLAAGLGLAVLPLLGETPPVEAPLILRMIVGGLLYGAFTALILIGTRQDTSLPRICGVVGFILQTLYVYAETFEGLIDTALFFLIGGLILFAASFALWQVRKRRATTAPGSETEPDTPDTGERS